MADREKYFWFSMISLIVHIISQLVDQLKETVKNTIDTMFSLDHLVSDRAITDAMDAQLFVPISHLLQLPQISKLTTDPQIVADSLSSSTLVQLDSNRTKCRPAVQPPPGPTIILHKIPLHTPVQVSYFYPFLIYCYSLSL